VSTKDFYVALGTRCDRRTDRAPYSEKQAETEQKQFQSPPGFVAQQFSGHLGGLREHAVRMYLRFAAPARRFFDGTSAARKIAGGLETDLNKVPNELGPLVRDGPLAIERVGGHHLSRA
jgi:hypothetical protein